MDGMIETQDVSRQNIDIRINNGNKEWVAKAHRIGSDGMLGFIRFDKLRGTLELTNFNAKLPRKALLLGASSKQNQDSMAGTHGEGFKVASLVMVRNGYQVRYESDKYYWKFKFGTRDRDKNQLYCRLTPMTDTKLTGLMSAECTRTARKQPRELKANIWEDVGVKIGNVYSSRTGGGKSIEFSVFEEWIKVAFALEHPQAVIKTNHGDLVLDKTFRGRMYLKGLYLGNSHTGKKLKFCYNLHAGTTTRDRGRLTNEKEEATVLANIWAEAIKNNEADALQEYTKMLRGADELLLADVNLASDRISPSTAKAIWELLESQDPEHQSFFYDQKTAARVRLFCCILSDSRES
jgi:hypothetical protein